MTATTQDSPPQAGEIDRFEAQRQAFSRLMARFTADRDAMIAAVQQCNERIDALVARVGSGDRPASASAEGGIAPDVSAITERALAQQEASLSEARAASDRALQRADEALRRWRETAEQVSEKDSGADALKQSVDKVSERLGRLEDLFMAQSAEPPPALDDTLVRETASRLASVEDLVRGLEDSLDGVRQQMEHPPAPPEFSAPQILDAGLRDLREQVSHLESMAAWTPKLQRLWVSLVASAMVAGFALVYVR